MPTCNVTLNGTFDAIPLVNEQSVNHVVTPTSNNMFSIALLNNQSVFFSTNYEISGTLNYALSITIFNKAKQTVGNIKIIQQLTNFSIDLLEGEYTICVRGLIGTYTGSIMAKFVGYSRNVILEPKNYYGQECSFELTKPKVETLCNQPLNYELVDGELPPNIKLLSSGQLVGIMPIIDCLPDNKDLPPSANLYYDSGEGDSQSSIESWERHYRFRAKVYLKNNPEKFAIEQFCISIVPDWSRTERRFNKTYTDITSVTEITVNERLKEIDLCDYVCSDLTGTPINTNDYYDATIKRINQIKTTDDNFYSTRLPKDENGNYIDEHVDKLILEHLGDKQSAYNVLEEMIYDSVDTDNKDKDSILNYTIDDNIEVVESRGTFAENDLLFIPKGMTDGEVFQWVEKYYYDIEYPNNLTDVEINEWNDQYKEPINNLGWIIEEYRDSLIYNRYREDGDKVIIKYFKNEAGQSFCDISLDVTNDVAEMKEYDDKHKIQSQKIPTTPRSYVGELLEFELHMGSK